jgi:hypothetical protein
MSTLRLEPSQMTTVDGHGLVVRFRRKALTNELATVLCNIGLVTCKWFEFDDLFAELAEDIRSKDREI